MWLSVAVHQARQLSKVVLYSRRMRNHGLENPRLYQSAHDLQRRDNQMILDFYKNTLERNLCLESAQGQYVNIVFAIEQFSSFSCHWILCRDIKSSMIRQAIVNIAEDIKLSFKCPKKIRSSFPYEVRLADFEREPYIAFLACIVFCANVLKWK